MNHSLLLSRSTIVRVLQKQKQKQKQCTCARSLRQNSTKTTRGHSSVAAVSSSRLIQAEPSDESWRDVVNFSWEQGIGIYDNDNDTSSNSTSSSYSGAPNMHQLESAREGWRVDFSWENGVGVYAGSDIPRFTTIIKSKAIARSKVRDEYMHSVQVSWNEYIQMDSPACLINHCCSNANVGIRDNEFGAYDFVALRDIVEGEELIWDHGTCEFDLSSSISGSFVERHEDIRARYGRYYAEYLHSWTPSASASTSVPEAVEVEVEEDGDWKQRSA